MAASLGASAADRELLDILLGNDAITASQHAYLLERDALSRRDILGHDVAEAPPTSPHATPDARQMPGRTTENDTPPPTNMTSDSQERDERRRLAVARKSSAKQSPAEVSYGSKGFRLATRDGRFETNLQWRAQLRYTTPFVSDPRQLAAFEAEDQSTFEARRLRMKIGGHGFRPWLKYYFEVDLEPTRSVGDDGATSSGRVIDWRIDIARFSLTELRVGQSKIDHNRERVDSAGGQPFVVRTMVNRSFTIDRQVGVQLRDHLFENSPADMRYWVGVFTGEGRGLENDDENMMRQGRLQWNFLCRGLEWLQTDVEFTELPTGSLAFGAVTNKERCTRWSSSACGNLDGLTSLAIAAIAQFKVEQMVQEFAFKWRGLSVQEEYHWRTVRDRVSGRDFDMQGTYTQVVYFFHNLVDAIPLPLKLAFRYACVDEPNRFDRLLENDRRKFTLGAN